MDPERPIEKLLRAQAKKRRDEAGAPFELHPTDRKVLQAEVERTFAKEKQSPSLLQSLRVLWPRLVWGTAILAVLAIIAFMLVPGSDKTNNEAFLAQNTPMSAEPPSRKLSPASAPALNEPLGTRSPAPSSELADLAYKKLPEKEAISEAPPSLSTAPRTPIPSAVPPTVAELRQAEPAAAAAPGRDEKPLSPPGQGPVLARNYGLLTAPSPAPVPSEMPAAAPSVASTEFFNHSPDNARLALASKPTIAADTAAPAITHATDALARNDGSNKDAQPAISQRFTQIQPPTKAKMAKLETAPPSTQVLAAFQVEQVGDELRIIDNDGSIYTGRLVAADAVRSRYTESKSSAASAVRVQSSERSFQTSAGSVSALQNFSFRVTGTNRSMNQNVVFTGNLVPATNPGSLMTVTNSVNSVIGGVQNYGAAENSNQLLNCRISGRAQIGKSKEIPIEAISAP